MTRGDKVNGLQTKLLMDNILLLYHNSFSASLSLSDAGQV